MQIDKARADHQPLGVDNPRRRAIDIATYARDSSVLDPEISHPPRRACAIDNRAAFDMYIEWFRHDYAPGYLLSVI